MLYWKCELHARDDRARQTGWDTKFPIPPNLQLQKGEKFRQTSLTWYGDGLLLLFCLILFQMHGKKEFKPFSILGYSVLHRKETWIGVTGKWSTSQLKASLSSESMLLYLIHSDFLLKASSAFWSGLNLDSWTIRLHWQAHPWGIQRWPGELPRANWDSYLADSLLSLLSRGAWPHSLSLSLLHRCLWQELVLTHFLPSCLQLRIFQNMSSLC